MRLLLALLFISIVTQPALAFTPEELQGKLDQIVHFREQRSVTNGPAITADDRKKAASGSVQTGLRGGAVYGVGILKAPIARLWAALNDEAGQMRYTKVTYSNLVSGTRCKPGRKILQMVDVPIPFAPDKWWIGQPKANEPLLRNSGGVVRELAFSSSVNLALITNPADHALASAASPIGYSKGAWFLVALDARHTYLEYHAYTNPGSGVPQGLATRLAVGAIKDNFHAMETFATQGNPSCPIK